MQLFLSQKPCLLLLVFNLPTSAWQNLIYGYVKWNWKSEIKIYPMKGKKGL